MHFAPTLADFELRVFPHLMPSCIRVDAGIGDLRDLDDQVLIGLAFGITAGHYWPGFGATLKPFGCPICLTALPAARA